jgi:large subunit ribosomal protein L21
VLRWHERKEPRLSGWSWRTRKSLTVGDEVSGSAKIQLDFAGGGSLTDPFSIFMKATIHTQGKQFTVTEGDVLVVDRFPSAEVGSTIQITEVMAAGEGADLRVGKPYLPEAVVTATVVKHQRGEKVVVFKKRRRKGYERKQGHRQELSVIKIESIKV